MWGLGPRLHCGSLQHSRDPLAGFKGAASRQDRNGGKGRTRGRREGKRRERGNGEGGEKGKFGRNSALVVGG